jgi:hypothetical protein
MPRALSKIRRVDFPWRSLQRESFLGLSERKSPRYLEVGLQEKSLQPFKADQFRSLVFNDEERPRILMLGPPLFSAKY